MVRQRVESSAKRYRGFSRESERKQETKGKRKLKQNKSNEQETDLKWYRNTLCKYKIHSNLSYYEGQSISNLKMAI